MRSFLTKHWPLLGIAIVLGVVGIYIVAAQKHVIKQSSLTEVVSGEGLKLNNIHYTQNNPDDGMKWILDADEVKFSMDRTFFSFRKFRLKLEPENRPRVELEGERGNYDKKSGEIHLHGDLKGYTDNGYRIITEHLLYNQKEGYLETAEPVKIFGPFFSVAGRGLYFDLPNEILKILSDTTTRITKGSLVL
jgi:LPS export ABC transporter protein LptC